MQRAERDLVRARLAATGGDPAAAASFVAAISGLRELSTPYHLAHGLLDHAGYLTRLGNTQAAAAAIGEARDIADNLRCQPLLDRAADITPAQSPVADEIAPLPDPEESTGPAGVIPAAPPDCSARRAQNDHSGAARTAMPSSQDKLEITAATRAAARRLRLHSVTDSCWPPSSTCGGHGCRLTAGHGKILFSPPAEHTLSAAEADVRPKGGDV